MSVKKNEYSTLHSITPTYLKVTRSESQSDVIIIVDVINNNQNGNIYEEASGSVIWLKFTANNQYEILNSEPSGKTAFSPSYSSMENMQMRLKGGELFVIEYNGTPHDDQNGRVAVTGFEIPSGYVAYVKIDTGNDKIIVYSSN